MPRQALGVARKTLGQLKFVPQRKMLDAKSQGLGGAQGDARLFERYRGLILLGSLSSTGALLLGCSPVPLKQIVVNS